MRVAIAVMLAHRAMTAAFHHYAVVKVLR